MVVRTWTVKARVDSRISYSEANRALKHGHGKAARTSRLKVELALTYKTTICLYTIPEILPVLFPTSSCALPRDPCHLITRALLMYRDQAPALRTFRGRLRDRLHRAHPSECRGAHKPRTSSWIGSTRIRNLAGSPADVLTFRIHALGESFVGDDGLGSGQTYTPRPRFQVQIGGNVGSAAGAASVVDGGNVASSIAATKSPVVVGMT